MSKYLHIGKCGVCGQKTSLVVSLDMCGPCTTGESDTAWPNGDEAEFAEEMNKQEAHEAPKAKKEKTK